MRFNEEFDQQFLDRLGTHHEALVAVVVRRLIGVAELRAFNRARTGQSLAAVALSNLLGARHLPLAHQQ